MLPVAEAEALILQAVQPLGTEWVELGSAQDRVLGQTLCSPQDFPAQPTSSMDGYALRYEDVQQGIPCELQVIETIPAGKAPTTEVQTGQAVRLYTGSVLPAGADTVVMQEYTQRPSETKVRILKDPQQGEFVRPQGSFARQGDPILEAGQRLRGAELAVLAAIRQAVVPVFRQPRVAILSTGDELVPIQQGPGPGQIVDSNQYGLAALVRAAGGIPVKLGIVPDQPQVLRERMQQALGAADGVISSGGVSVGDFDYVEKLLEELGGKIFIRSVAIKPGKPLTVARFSNPHGPDQLYFGLPGNPASALVTFWRFLRPALLKMGGSLPPYLEVISATSPKDLHADGKREHYLWGKLRLKPDQIQFQPADSHHSGNLINLAGCDALAVLPPGTTQIPAGSPVQVLRLL
ncbi:molybdopterin molybdotransferase MoeA [Synechococcus sp. Nb3U1]|uniref:molybdopterin molybdotransferase MoeA n=1 Tax=Synechococcus sp. Nb3U1 TaxID=1914529 RepID=UPI001F322535|nr:gephyrin-like molybdotransferase Glp [Synechococcus sp. Nb3U1]MCF2971730.1 molybdopterin molybdotransferase MoeA [Synechococcus sp. Nb3U1]